MNERNERTETHACDLEAELVNAGDKTSKSYWALQAALMVASSLPPAQPEIIRCKDCRKHNISVGYQKDCCPLYHYRGMSFGGEHDLQFCSYAERRTDG